MHDHNDESSVGYKKPPKESQFKKGSSGNPKGRPKGRKSLLNHLDDELAKHITVMLSGKRRSIPAAQAIAMKTVEKALKGEQRMLLYLLNRSNAIESDLDDDVPDVVTIEIIDGRKPQLELQNKIPKD